MLQRPNSSLDPAITAFRPIADKVLLRRHARPSEVGGIFIPKIAMHVDQAKFDVIAIGPKCDQVHVGDIALAPCQMAFPKINLNGESLEVAPEKTLTAYIPAS
jgi:co-chaperonin GroES (HSP10)